jgi:hypothetical protein
MNKLNVVCNIGNPSNNKIKKEIKELELLISQTKDQEKLIWLKSCLFRIKNRYYS